MDAQLEQAVQIAAAPQQSDPQLVQQAFNYANTVKSSEDGWQAALPLFIRPSRATDTVRLFCLEILKDAIERRSQHPENEGLQYIKQMLLDYVRTTYSPVSTVSDSAMIQNKLSQVITLLFVALYTTSWQTFFDDLMILGKSSPNGVWDNLPGIQFFMRTSASVHDEVADVLIPRTPQEGRRNIMIKDCVRERDMRKLVIAWQEIMEQLKDTNSQVVEMGLRVIGRWVSWIDISLVVNELMLSQLFQFMDFGGTVRDAAISALTEIVGKKMKGPDKLDLLIFLNVGQIVAQIAQSPALQDQKADDYDTELAEGTAKLINTATMDLVLILSREEVDAATKRRADELLQTVLPLMLRFFSDEYDDVSQAVFPVTLELLSLLRKEKKLTGTLGQAHAAMLPSILNAVVLKTKYDADANWGDEDEQSEEAEFQHLRQRLKTMQDALSVIDENLYMDSLSQLVETTFSKLAQNGHNSIDWRDVDLALYEMSSFGEMAMRAGGLFSKGQASGVAAEKLIGMLGQMMASNVADHPHPVVRLKSMEIFMRHASFFEVYTDFIPQALESFNKCIHDGNIRVCTRSWYLFHRFVRSLRQHIGKVAETILGVIGDLLAIHAELPKDNEVTDMSDSGQDANEDSTFMSQTYLFEAVGLICSVSTLPPEKQALLLKSVSTPLFDDLDTNLPRAENGDSRATLQIHHDITALGTVAKGFSDWTVQGGRMDKVFPPQVSEEFMKASEAILVALERLSRFPVVREAARFAFARILGVSGSDILPLLPRWISGLMSKSSTKEISVFLKLMDQLIHGFRNVIYDMLNELLTPLLQRVFVSLSEPVTGTDDNVQLTELRKEFLNFILVILNNDLGQVMVSEANRDHFETLLTAIEHYARENTDASTQKVAFNLINKMSYVFGPLTGTVDPKNNNFVMGTIPPQEQPLAGFETIMNERFSILCWEAPCANDFNARDAQGRMVIGEIASLQKMLYLKLGEPYLETLKGAIFPRIGVIRGVDEYCSAVSTMDLKELKIFYQKFLREILGVPL